MDEKYFDACTALAGSGPAFVALMLEAMADGGVMMGLPRVEAVELAAQSGCDNEETLGVNADISGDRIFSHAGRRSNGSYWSAPSTTQR